MQLYEVIPQGIGFILVMEYVPLSLWELIRDPRYEIFETHCKTYIKMLLNGLAHMHDKNLMHRVMIIIITLNINLYIVYLKINC